MTQPQVQSLDALIAVQPGAVVSREIVSRSAGTVTLFAFDVDQGLSEHTAPYDALVYALEGAVEITVSGKPFTVNAGEMLIMPAHEPHGLKALSPLKMLLVMIRA
ncbi:MAG: Cupin domain protein [Chloroflexi bacterium ADurb.Bin222]|nr:MAG: Cupin domain protein [Chloroflexi bacterium ADurb.Bin222]